MCHQSHNKTVEKVKISISRMIFERGDEGCLSENMVFRQFQQSHALGGVQMRVNPFMINNDSSGRHLEVVNTQDRLYQEYCCSR